MKRALLVLLRGVLSVLLLFVLSIALRGTPSHVPINIPTVSLGATLGLPGIIMLIILFTYVIA